MAQDIGIPQEEAKEALFDADRQTRRDHDPQSYSSEPGKPPGSQDSDLEDEIERAFPNATDRRAFVTAMAEAILMAHEVNPLSWSLSGHRGLALNVGKNSSLATTPQAMFVATGTQDALVEELLSVGITANVGPYSFPESVHWISLPDGASFAEGFAPLRDNFLETIAATAVHKTRHWRSFSEEWAVYLEAELGIELPRPPQSHTTNTDQVIWDLAPGDTIKRTVLHDRFGGGRQGGIAGSANTPNVMIFTDPSSGLEHGYTDGWTDDGSFLYTGEGQRGDHEFKRGNKAIRDHASDGKALRLFDGTGRIVTYTGEFELDEPAFHWTHAPETGGGPERKVIVFHLKPIDAIEPARLVAIYVGKDSEPNLTHSMNAAETKWGWKTNQDDYSVIESGDLVLFAMGYSGGSPRVKLDEYLAHTLERIVLARATGTVHDDTSKYWPDESDEVSYPYRLGFEVLEERSDQPIADLDVEFGGEVAEGLRMSDIVQGRGVIVEVDNRPVVPSDPVAPMPFDAVATHFADALAASGRDYGKRHDTLTKSFLASLATKRFLILTGLSGSGKTQLALGFGQWLGKDETLVVAVRPDWTSPESLLGFENALSDPGETKRYAWNAPEALRFMLRAHDNPTKPHLLLLDEMNLAHVERYFADLLSGIESGEAVLPNLEEGSDGQWRQHRDEPYVAMPENLFVVGTVNVDETTYMFSPKVLDRANTIEFRVETDDLRTNAGPLVAVPAAEPGLVAGFITTATTTPSTDGDADFADTMKQVHALLSAHDREFGHRTFLETRQFAQHLAAAGEADESVAIDLAVLQKILPKLHGSRSELTGLLNELGEWCFSGPGTSPSTTLDAAEPPADQDAKLPLSFNKLHRMAKRLRDNHFVSFAE